jgi:plastocyanin
LIGLAAVVLVVWIVTKIVMMSAMSGWGWGGMGRMHGGGRNTSNDAVVVGALTETIDISDFTFSPGNLEVPAGATVTWTNRDSAVHNAVDRGGEWRTENLSRGESDSIAFENPGDYDYYCSIHPSMKARLTVR